MTQPLLAEKAFNIPPAREIVSRAKAARAKQQWRLAALLFTQAADELPTEPHGHDSVAAITLRRDAHLALCRTEQFRAYRERRRKLKRKDFSDEWIEPSGALVRHVLQRKPLGG